MYVQVCPKKLRIRHCLYVRMLEGGLQPNTTALSLLSVVSKIFEKLVNQLVDHLKISGLFSDF